MNYHKQIVAKIYSVSIFRNLLKTKELSSLIKFLSFEGDNLEKLNLYSEFVSSLSDCNCSFSDFLTKAIREDENFYIISKAKELNFSDSVEKNLLNDLEVFTFLSSLTPYGLTEGINEGGFIPLFDSKETDFVAFYRSIIENIGSVGYGIFATGSMFRVEDDEIRPIDSRDNIDLSSFIGYEREREKVINNTLNLLNGKDAANVLLCGDAGTGKSSTVKACVNHFADRGLRLIEIRKDQLFALPKIMDKIADNPLKFIIFIDDLSFNKNDDCFSMLKAALEGSASAKSKNALIYATSNRRHIVKENFSDRNGDDIHRNDTVQELLSLSERFGLVVNFSKPNKILYLDIVHALAAKKGIKMSKEELEVKAEAFALAKCSRSPRAAEQFIKSL